jgi:hypothetical protein
MPVIQPNEGDVLDILNARSKHLPGYGYKLGNNQYGMDAVINEKPDFDTAKMSLWLTFADGNRRDGVGDLLEVGGIRTERHLKNPLCLFDHSKKIDLPIGMARDRDTWEYTVLLDPVNQIAKLNCFFYDGKGIKGVDRRDEYSHALFCEQLYDLAIKAFVIGGSIGYQVIHAKSLQADHEYGIPPGLHLISTLMLEASLVVMPANMDTVREVLTKDRVCGKRLSPVLVKSLSAYSPTEVKTVSGWEPTMAEIRNKYLPQTNNKFFRFGVKSAEYEWKKDMEKTLEKRKESILKFMHEHGGTLLELPYSDVKEKEAVDSLLHEGKIVTRGGKWSIADGRGKSLELAKSEKDANGGLVPEDTERARSVDLISLPIDVKGTNCGNCKFVFKGKEGGYCTNNKVNMPVNDRMCCALWDNEGVRRAWEGGSAVLNNEAPQMGAKHIRVRYKNKVIKGFAEVRLRFAVHDIPLDAMEQFVEDMNKSGFGYPREGKFASTSPVRLKLPMKTATFLFDVEPGAEDTQGAVTHAIHEATGLAKKYGARILGNIGTKFLDSGNVFFKVNDYFANCPRDETGHCLPKGSAPQSGKQNTPAQPIMPNVGISKLAQEIANLMKAEAVPLTTKDHYHIKRNGERIATVVGDTEVTHVTVSELIKWLDKNGFHRMGGPETNSFKRGKQ